MLWPRVRELTCKKNNTKKIYSKQEINAKMKGINSERRSCSPIPNSANYRIFQQFTRTSVRQRTTVTKEMRSERRWKSFYSSVHIEDSNLASLTNAL